MKKDSQALSASVTAVNYTSNSPEGNLVLTGNPTLSTTTITSSGVLCDKVYGVQSSTGTITFPSGYYLTPTELERYGYISNEGETLTYASEPVYEIEIPICSTCGTEVESYSVIVHTKSVTVILDCHGEKERVDIPLHRFDYDIKKALDSTFVEKKQVFNPEYHIPAPINSEIAKWFNS